MTTIDGFIAAAQQSGCQVSKGSTGSSDWERVFVTYNGISIARGSFCKGKLGYYKSYKPWLSEPVDEMDRALINLSRILKGKSQITAADLSAMEVQAKKLRQQDLNQKLQWRKDNPKLDKDGAPKHRRRIEGRSIRFFLAEMLSNLE